METGRTAYVGWPLVNNANRAKAFSEAPEPGLLGGALPIAFNANAMLTGYVSPEQTFVTRTNQDVAWRGLHGARQGTDRLPGSRLQRSLLGLRDHDARTDEFSRI